MEKFVATKQNGGICLHINDIIIPFNGVCYRREDAPKQSSNKLTELKYVLELETGSIFDEDEWITSKNMNSYNGGEVRGFCICTKNIGCDYYLQNKKTGRIFAVGSKCVQNVSEKLYSQMIRGKCKQCDSALIDRRRKYQRDGLCDMNCSNNFLRTQQQLVIPQQRLCKYCDEPLTTRSKGGFCNYQCLHLNIEDEKGQKKNVIVAIMRRKDSYKRITKYW